MSLEGCPRFSSNNSKTWERPLAGLGCDGRDDGVAILAVQVTESSGTGGKSVRRTGNHSGRVESEKSEMA